MNGEISVPETAAFGVIRKRQNSSAFLTEGYWIPRLRRLRTAERISGDIGIPLEDAGKSVTALRRVVVALFAKAGGVRIEEALQHRHRVQVVPRLMTRQDPWAIRLVAAEVKNASGRPSTSRVPDDSRHLSLVQIPVRNVVAGITQDHDPVDVTGNEVHPFPGSTNNPFARSTAQSCSVFSAHQSISCSAPGQRRSPMNPRL